MPKTDNTKKPATTDEEFIFDELKSLDKLVRETEGMPDDLEEKLHQMLSRLNRMARLGHYAAEFDTLARYIETIAELPWSKKTEDNLDLDNARKVLNKNHHGLDYVKERIIEYLATTKLLRDRSENPQEVSSKSLVLMFVGLQGIGKTTLAASIAEAMGKEFIRIPLGGIGSTFELRGRSKAFAGAEPGQIIKALMKTGVKNPLILLDEIDKASGESGLRSDVMSVLLEILDPEQNTAFRDYYIDYPLDLTDIMFICSANNTGTISTPLMDRLEVVKMPAYTDDEKIAIGRDHLFPQVIESSGLKPEELQIDPNLWPSIVRPFGFDSGIRSLHRTLDAISRKAAREIVEGETDKVFINSENLKHYLPK
jgi:ATP-dependent Lon protease